MEPLKHRNTQWFWIRLNPSVIFLFSKISASQIWSSGSFEELYFHCSSAEEWSSSHIFWGDFIIHLSISIALYVWIIYISSLLRHITGDIERPLIFRSFYVSICCTVINISLIYITSSRKFSSRFSLNQVIWAIQSLMNQIWYKKNFSIKQNSEYYFTCHSIIVP